MKGTAPFAETFARAFHQSYERLAPSFDYVTRSESAVPWEDVPESNRKLMVAVVGEVFSATLAHIAELEQERDRAESLMDAWRVAMELARAERRGTAEVTNKATPVMTERPEKVRAVTAFEAEFVDPDQLCPCSTLSDDDNDADKCRCTDESACLEGYPHISMEDRSHD